MSSEVMVRKRKSLADSSSKPKIPKLIPIHRIFESAQSHNASDSLRHRRLQVCDGNNNDRHLSSDCNKSSQFQAKETDEQLSLVEAADLKSEEPHSAFIPMKTNDGSACASDIYSIKQEPCRNSADQEQNSIENNSKRVQTDKQRRARQSFLLITVIDHNKILRVYCHDTTKPNCMETKSESDLNNNESGKGTAQSSPNLNTSSKIISPIRLAKSKDGSWHPKDTCKVSMQDFEMQTDSPKQVSKPVSLADFQAEIEFSKNLLSKCNELDEKKSKIEQLNELKSRFAKYPLKDQILIPKVSWRRVLDSPYKGLLKLFMEKPDFYFQKDCNDQIKVNLDFRDCHRVESEEYHSVSLQLLEEILKTFAEQSAQPKNELLMEQPNKANTLTEPLSVKRSMRAASKVKATVVSAPAPSPTSTPTPASESDEAVLSPSSEELRALETGGAKDFDEIDNERTAMFNQLTLMKYWHEASFLPSPKSLNVNYTNNSYNFNNFNNVSDQLLRKLFFSNPTATASAMAPVKAAISSDSNLNQQTKTPKFFSNSSYKSSSKSHGKKFSRILDLSRTTNVPIVRPNDNFNYFINNKPSLEARSSALYDFHF